MTQVPLRLFRFDGPEYRKDYDQERLSQQFERVRSLMLDGHWRSIREIAQATGDPEASVSAQLRHMRKARFGSYVVDRKPSGDRARGLYIYRVLPPGTPTEHRKTQREVIAELRARIAHLEAQLAEVER